MSVYRSQPPMRRFHVELTATCAGQKIALHSSWNAIDEDHAICRAMRFYEEDMGFKIESTEAGAVVSAQPESVE